MIYQYTCVSCHHEWEADQSIKDPPLTHCPECGVAAATRAVTGGSGFTLKGGGWASSNYAKPPAR